MTWQAFIFLSIIFYSTSVLLQRTLLKDKDSDPIAYSIFSQIIVGMVVILVGLLTLQDMSMPAIGPLLFNIILMGVLYGVFHFASFTSLKEGEASQFTIIFSSRVFFTTLASALFLKEVLIGEQVLGALFIFSGVVLVSLKKAKLILKRSELLALLAAMSFGFANTVDRTLLMSFNLYPYTALSFFLTAGILLLVRPKSISKMKVFSRKDTLSKMLMFSTLYAFSSIAFYGALQLTNNSSQVVTVSLLSVIVIVLLSAIFLKERGNLSRKIIGAILSFIGLLLVT